jgi:hypothetical protein
MPRGALAPDDLQPVDHPQQMIQVSFPHPELSSQPVELARRSRGLT